MTSGIMIVIAGIMGAGGVALAAAAAHAAPGAGLDSAASMLLFHAAAAVAGVVAVNQGLVSRPLGLAAIAAWQLGAVLFAGDVALRVLAGARLFPMAAPAGGLILIAGWLLLALAAILFLLRQA